MITPAAPSDCSCVTGSRADAGGTGRVAEEEVGASAAACHQDGQVRWQNPKRNP